MRLLLVTHYYSTHSGGVEMAARDLARGMAEHADIEVEWLASDCDPVPPGIGERAQCTPMPSWNGIERACGWPYPLWRLSALRSLWDAVQRCDVLHVHDALYMGNVMAFLFARRQRKPVMVTQHTGAMNDGSVMGLAGSALNRTLGRFVLGRADRVFFISPAALAYFLRFVRFHSEPVHVANGVDTGVFMPADDRRRAELRAMAGRDPGRPLCLFVGRFIESKGVGLLLALAKAFPNVDWVFAGHGDLRPERSGLRNVSVMRGQSRQAIAALYQMADLLLLPSRREGFPLVVQEAMACGAPVLVSEEAAAGSPAVAPMMFVERVEGSDAGERWRARLSDLLGRRNELQAMRPRLAEAARRQWSWSAAASIYATAARELLEGRSVSG